LVDPRVGIVNSCSRVRKDRREPALPVVFQATLSNFDFHKGSDVERTASGKGLSDDEAATKAIVEALERYCATQRRPNALVVGVAGSLDAPAILPEELVIHSERQYASPEFAYVAPTRDAELTWVRATLLGSGRPAYAPASLVYMDFVGT